MAVLRDFPADVAGMIPLYHDPCLRKKTFSIMEIPDIVIVRMNRGEGEGMRLFNTYFWSGLLIVAGVLMIAKYSLNLRFSTPRVLFGLIIIYIGCFVLFGGSGWGGGIRSGANLVFGNGHIPVHALEDEYNIIFSNGSIDMTDMDEVPSDGEVEVNVVFGSGVLRINPDIPIVIKMSAAFGSVEAPDRSSAGFGENIYRTPAAQAGGDYLEIEANAVFGRLEIVER